MLEPPSTSRAFDSDQVQDAYGLWLGSWETALKAVATAAQTRTLSTSAAAAHKAAIAAERKLVTKHFLLLAARGLLGERPMTEQRS